MGKDDLIWSEPGQKCTIRLARTLSSDVLALLKGVVWGTGSTRYRIVDLSSKLARLRNAYIFTLEASGHLMAVCVLDRCEKELLDTAHDAFHFVMIATATGCQDKGYASLLVDHVQRFCRRELRRPGLAFAYVEATTLFSRQIADRVGHAFEADMRLAVFSRLFPSTHRLVRPLAEAEKNGMVDRLSTLYEGHNMTDFSAAVNVSDYRVLRRGGKVAVGLQFETLNWSVTSLPGVTGWAILHFLPMIPVLNSIVTPRDLRFLRFGNILVEPGCEDDLACLMESVLAERGASLGLIMMDSKCPVLERILGNVRLGILSHALKGSAKLCMDFVGVSDQDIAHIKTRPVFASTADVF